VNQMQRRYSVLSGCIEKVTLDKMLAECEVRQQNTEHEGVLFWRYKPDV
jgi:hypothetical protein